MSATRRVVVDDTDSLIQYGSSWTQQQGNRDGVGSQGAPFKSTLHSTKSNTTITMKFAGTGFSVIGSVNIKKVNGVQDPQWECIVDNISLKINSFSEGLEENNQNLCSQPVLSEGEHEVVVQVTSRGSEFWFDYFQYLPTANLDLSSSIVKVDNTDPSISYSGFGALSDFANLTQKTDATMKFNFIGKSISWTGYIVKQLARNQSSATYAIDDGEPTTFRLNGLTDSAGESLANQVFFTTPDLKPGPHSLLVTHKGNGQQTPLSIDYLIVTNGTSSSQATTGSTTSKKTPVGAIVGGVVGGVVVIACLILFLLWLRRRRRRDARRRELDLIGPVDPSETVQITPFTHPPGLGSTGFVQSKDGAVHRPLLSGGISNLSDYSEVAATTSGGSQSYYGTENQRLTVVGAETQSGQSAQAVGKRQEAAAESTHSRPSRVLHHQDSGIRMPEPEEDVIEVPPTYTPA